ncbi:zinc-finger of the MIZ type in Nse subunit-domain-containing protein [Xylariaceae sp. FL0662B]|nr:zinc-finger of the MIZ type in Nse subunit-domain-containing protein [Xylariaceae sp. FL0662B]
MSSRRLVSGAERNRRRPNTSSSSHTQQDRGPVQLPEYEPPSCPLNETSRRALAELSTNQDTRKYEEQLKQSLKLLGDSVRDINDKYTERKATLKRLQEKRGEDGEKNDRERAEEKAVLALKGDVPQLTDECDHAVRNVVDLMVELEDGREALQETVRKVELESANAVSRRADDENEDDAMMDVPDITGPSRLLKAEKDRAAASYASKTLYERYGLNNDYVGFKRLWHDAAHGSDGKPLPDASKWFTQNGADGEADDDDDDLIVAEERLDIHCPLSMVVMKDPWTSRKCKHTFEKRSIEEFLGGRPGRRARCPQTGCNHEVSIDDFYADQIMLRKIKRAEAKEHRGMEDDEDDVDSDGDEDVQLTQGRNIKVEREGRGRGAQLVMDIQDED